MHLAGIILSGFVLCLSSAAFARCPENKTAQPFRAFEQAGTLLFIADDCTGKPVNYVYGTVHSDAANVKEMAAPAFAAVAQVEQVGFEYLSPANANEVAARAMYLPPNAPPIIPKILSAEEYQRLLKVLVKDRRMEETVVKQMQPWAAAVLMQMPVSTGDGIILDDRLKVMAQESGKNLFGLETMQQQLDIFQRMPKAMQVTMLKESLQDIEKIDIINTLLQEAYVGKNLEALAALGEESFASIRDENLREYMRQALLIKRNHTMVAQMLPQFTQGKSMVAVGALHLTGKEGVLNLLQQQGYRITPVRSAPAAAKANTQ